MASSNCLENDLGQENSFDELKLELLQSFRAFIIVDTLICIWFVAKEIWKVYRYTHTQHFHRKVIKNIKP